MPENTYETYPPESPAAPAAVQESQDATTGLNVGDLEFAVQLADHAANEGILKGWQMIERVAQHRARLINFMRQLPAPVAAEQVEGVAQ